MSVNSRRIYGRHFLLASIIAMLSVSCNDNNKRAEALLKLESKPIDICTKELPCILEGRDTIDYMADTTGYTLVAIVDSSECTSCYISHIDEWYEWMEMAANDSVPLSMIFILQPKQEQAMSVALRLKRTSKYCKEIPFYLDVNGKFLKRNAHIPQDKELHTFLIDSNKKVIFVGNPIRYDAVAIKIKEILGINIAP